MRNVFAISRAFLADNVPAYSANKRQFHSVDLVWKPKTHGKAIVFKIYMETTSNRNGTRVPNHVEYMQIKQIDTSRHDAVTCAMEWYHENQSTLVPLMHQLAMSRYHIDLNNYEVVGSANASMRLYIYGPYVGEGTEVGTITRFSPMRGRPLVTHFKVSFLPHQQTLPFALITSHYKWVDGQFRLTSMMQKDNLSVCTDFSSATMAVVAMVMDSELDYTDLYQDSAGQRFKIVCSDTTGIASVVDGHTHSGFLLSVFVDAEKRALMPYL